MGKKNKGFDVIAEAHERANNNINPYYWMNRVTLHKLAQWRVNKMLAPVFFVLLSIVGYVVLSIFSEIAAKQDQSLLSFIFDFTDSATTYRFVSILFVCFYWAVSGVATIQNVLHRIFSPPPPKLEVKKNKKKKHPKRPKNYK